MAQTSTHHEILDPVIFSDYRELLDDKFEDGLHRFVVDLGNLATEVRLGFDVNDGVMIQDAVHRLKSSSALIGALHISKIAHKIETQIKCGVDPNEADIEKFNTAANDLRDLLLTHLAEH